MPTIGTLSGFVTINRKFGSSMLIPRKANMHANTIPPDLLVKNLSGYFSETRSRMAAAVIRKYGAVIALMISLMNIFVLSIVVRKYRHHAGCARSGWPSRTLPPMAIQRNEERRNEAAPLRRRNGRPAKQIARHSDC